MSASGLAFAFSDLDLVEVSSLAQHGQAFAEPVRLLIHRGVRRLAAVRFQGAWWTALPSERLNVWERVPWADAMVAELTPVPLEIEYFFVSRSQYENNPGESYAITVCLGCGARWKSSEAHPPTDCIRSPWRALGKPRTAWVCLACRTGTEVATWYGPGPYAGMGCTTCGEWALVPLAYHPQQRHRLVLDAFRRDGQLCEACLKPVDVVLDFCPEHRGGRLVAPSELPWLDVPAFLAPFARALGFDSLDDTAWWAIEERPRFVRDGAGVTLCQTHTLRAHVEGAGRKNLVPSTGPCALCAAAQRAHSEGP